jgi:hypothetical protein
MMPSQQTQFPISQFIYRKPRGAGWRPFAPVATDSLPATNFGKQVLRMSLWMYSS